MIENWKDVPGYESLYQVSDLGNVRSLTRRRKTKKGIRTYQGKILTFGKHSAGYSVVNLSLKGKVRQVYVHRLVAICFVDGYFEGTQVNHKDLNKSNNHYSNLEYVTSKGNMLHAAQNGVKVGKTILTAEQRKQIRILRAHGVKLKIIANQYNISESAVSEVFRGTTWGWEENEK